MQHLLLDNIFVHVRHCGDLCSVLLCDYRHKTCRFRKALQQCYKLTGGRHSKPSGIFIWSV